MSRRQLTDGQIKAVLNKQQAEVERYKRRIDALESGEAMARLIEDNRHLLTQNALLLASQPMLLERNKRMLLSDTSVFKEMMRLTEQAEDGLELALSMALAASPFESVLAEITGAVLYARGELLKEGLRTNAERLTRTYNTWIEVLEGDEVAISEARTIYALFLTGIDNVLTGVDRGEYLRDAISSYRKMGETLQSKWKQMSRGAEAHTDLIGEIAIQIRDEGYSWKETVVELRKRLRDTPDKEFRHYRAISNLENYGNFWDSREPHYSHDHLEKAIGYVRPIEIRRRKRTEKDQ